MCRLGLGYGFSCAVLCCRCLQTGAGANDVLSRGAEGAWLTPHTSSCTNIQTRTRMHAHTQMDTHTHTCSPLWMCRSGADNRNKLHLLEDATGQAVPEEGAKPVYHNVLCVSMFISPDQSMSYLANPQTGKKVRRNGLGSQEGVSGGAKRVCQTCRPGHVQPTKFWAEGAQAWVRCHAHRRVLTLLLCQVRSWYLRPLQQTATDRQVCVG
jgi:hypothetical protein